MLRVWRSVTATEESEGRRHQITQCAMEFNSARSSSAHRSVLVGVAARPTPRVAPHRRRQGATEAVVSSAHAAVSTPDGANDSTDNRGLQRTAHGCRGGAMHRGGERCSALPLRKSDTAPRFEISALPLPAVDLPVGPGAALSGRGGRAGLHWWRAAASRSSEAVPGASLGFHLCCRPVRRAQRLAAAPEARDEGTALGAVPPRNPAPSPVVGRQHSPGPQHSGSPAGSRRLPVVGGGVERHGQRGRGRGGEKRRGHRGEKSRRSDALLCADGVTLRRTNSARLR